ncbi:MAG TPA: serine/threonine-protein kinase, partial [Polyangiaceae bacterium]|nr:serine/threonine-protein kinase [Polyangiaceae bacterium]
MNRAPAASGKASARLADWPGTERYRARRCIGAGAVGAVYEAFDAERGVTIALKRLRHFSPAALYHFKQEFRTIADVHHPNLVRLHELVATEDREVFFTMELVRGADLVAHVREGGAPDFDRLRDALRRLAEAVQALHAAGKIHRDIKPSNVLVTAEGRVVLLDFGVATELSRSGDDDAEDQPIVGTASYMAPEQAA